MPGFYDDVDAAHASASGSEFAALPFDEKEFMRADRRRRRVGGEAGYTTLERRWARPTFDINGLWSGYQGEGAKTVLPARAAAKFSFRLVPNQDPAEDHRRAGKAAARICAPPGIEMELIDFHGAPGVVVPLDSPYVAAAERAIEHGFGRRPVFMREGGSIPVVATFHDLLGVDTLLLGWGQDDDNTHSPNEKFSPGRLPSRHQGQRALVGRTEQLEMRCEASDATDVACESLITQPSIARPCSTADSLSKMPTW